MKFRFLKPYILFILIYGVVCFFIFFQSFNTLYPMLVFNTFLATLPMVFIMISSEFKKKNKRIMHIIFLLLWLLFYPNALYMITDFIHITRDNLIYFKEVPPYQSGGGTFYNNDILGWMKLLVIGLGVFYATLMGIKSLDFVLKSYSAGGKVFQVIILVTTSFLSGMAVYIGRFLRLNSWDILNPIMLLKNVFSAMDRFSVSFSLIFALYILGIYGIYKLIIKEA